MVNARIITMSNEMCIDQLTALQIIITINIIGVAIKDLRYEQTNSKQQIAEVKTNIYFLNSARPEFKKFRGAKI